MIKLRYSPNSGVDIAGPKTDLLDIETSILNLARVGAGKIEIAGYSTGSPAPYESWLERLVILVGRGPILASVGMMRDLNVSADPKYLRALAAFFHFSESAKHGSHNHLDFYPGNESVMEESEPIVISLV